jgi:hypothetical protein
LERPKTQGGPHGVRYRGIHSLTAIATGSAVLAFCSACTSGGAGASGSTAPTPGVAATRESPTPPPEPTPPPSNETPQPASASPAGSASPASRPEAASTSEPESGSTSSQTGSEIAEASAPHGAGDVPPPTGAAGPAEGGERATPPVGPLTEDETVVVLDHKLQESLEEFEKLLEQDQRELAGEVARGTAGGPPGGGGSGSGTGAGGGGDDSDASASPGGGEAPPGQGEPEDTQGGGVPTAGDDRPEVPPDVGDGSDDDIVARQLREAAMAEKDPELRERLWDEYRRYKGSTGGTTGSDQ